MTTIENPAQGRQARVEIREKADLILSAVVILLASRPIADMLAEAWDSGELSYPTFIALQHTLGVGYLDLVLAGLGVYLGLVALILLDDIKRVQGLLLALATVAVVVWLRSVGLLSPLYPLANLDVLAVGCAAGFLLGGGYRLRHTSRPTEFRRATTILFWTVSAVVAAAFVERHFLATDAMEAAAVDGVMAASLSNQLMVDAAIGSTFLLGAYLFTTYESQRAVSILGVQRAGKTFLTGALSMAALEEADTTRLNPSAPLSRLMNALRVATNGWGNDEYTGPTAKGEFYLLRFQVIAGRLFKRYVSIEALDYAGEYLDDVTVETVAEVVPTSRLSLRWLRYRLEVALGLVGFPDVATGLDSDRIRRTLAKQILHADTLVLIVDSGSLVDDVLYGASDYDVQRDLAEYLDAYIQILKHLDQSVLPRKDVVLVLTKADYLLPAYERSDSSLTFYNWVNFHLLESDLGREKLGGLLNQAQVDRIYPIFYEIDVDASTASGEPVPQRPIDIFGGADLLARLKGGA